MFDIFVTVFLNYYYYYYGNRTQGTVVKTHTQKIQSNRKKKNK